MIRIAFIDNVSSAAFTALPPPFPVDWTNAGPTGVYHALATGTFEAGLASTVRLRDLESFMEPLGAYGIACRGAVSSVRFFGRAPLSELLSRGAPIYLPDESQTARRLFEVLCRYAYGVAPRLHPDACTAAGTLRVGNEALNVNLPEQSWPTVLDLGEWWYTVTELPFVFARWVVRRDLNREKRRALEGWLDATVSASQRPKKRDAMLRRHPGVFENVDVAAHYFGQLQHRLGIEHFAGMKTFLRMHNSCDHAADTAPVRRRLCERVV